MIFQLGSTLLGACVLSVLSDGDAYGYVLTQNIKEIVTISESTLYPVLRKLQKEDCLTVYDQPYSGRLRRYYALTDKGRETLDMYRQEWNDFKIHVDRIMKT